MIPYKMQDIYCQRKHKNDTARLNALADHRENVYFLRALSPLLLLKITYTENNDWGKECICCVSV